MGSIKDRRGWQEYTEELYKKDLHDPDNQDGVIIHLEPDILECEVKWVLLPPIPPSIRVFSNESTFRMRCPKYWSFSFIQGGTGDFP